MTTQPGIIRTWEIESSTVRGGRRALYTVILDSNGTLSCNCPGWVFHNKRQCKHTMSVASAAAGYYAEWLAEREGGGRRRMTRPPPREVWNQQSVAPRPKPKKVKTKVETKKQDEAPVEDIAFKRVIDI